MRCAPKRRGWRLHLAWRMTGHWACLLAICLATGGHWLVLQSVAWGRMLAIYARQDSFGVALAKTFDGKHPCAMCQAVERGRQEEEERAPTLSSERLPELFYERRSAAVPWPALAREEPAPGDFRPPASFHEPPPKPPPRAA
ncbi:MAG: hypothetical protein FJ387_09450 [Verrucomicrobia bacterium]|nr:hypothetical protein [Verrucomicrobiota bacterium]